jgi:hypothetical protein
MLDNLLIGGIAGVISRTCTAPIELIKIQQQNKYLPNTTIKDVLKKEGFFALWKGNYVNSIRIFPQMAINYYIYQLTKTKLNNFNINTNLQHFLSGSMAGIISMTTIYPLENIRSRLALQTNKDHYKGIIDVFKKTKISNLYNGLNMSIIGFAPYNALKYMIYEFLIKESNKDKYNKINKNVKQLLCGGLSGTLAVTVTYPTDLIRRRLQLQDFDSKVPQYNGINDGIKKIYKLEGIKGFYRGLIPCYMNLFPSLAIQFYVIEKLNKYKKY